MALEGTLVRVLAEVVSQVTALGEHCLAAWVKAAEVELDALVRRTLHLAHIVPLIRDTIEVFSHVDFLKTLKGVAIQAF